MNIVKDFRNTAGHWVRSFTSNGKQIYTRSGKLYDGMQSRCRVGGKTQETQPTYIGCSHSPLFGDFQMFVEWCHSQVGWKEVGFALEKDILVRGNMTYSEDTCVFVPQAINNLLLRSRAIRGQYPIGVSKDKRYPGFQATCRYGVGRESRYCGSYRTVEEAFGAYKAFKESVIQGAAKKFREVIDLRAYNALMQYEVLITD